MTPFPFDALRRWPDYESDNLVAVDAADRLVLDQADAAIRAAAPGTIVTVGDEYGALTLGSVAAGATGVRSFQDQLTAELALAANFSSVADQLDLTADNSAYSSVTLDSALFQGAEVVLLRLPKDLSELKMYAQMIQKFASPKVQVFAVGRLKFMTLSMNDILRECFEQVTPSLSRQKSRVIHASRPLPVTEMADHLTQSYDQDLNLWVCSYPGTFASSKVDLGTRFLLSQIEKIALLAGQGVPLAVDLGCGSGVLATVLLRDHPQVAVLATDRSLSATRSAAATVSKNFPHLIQGPGAGRFQVRRDNGLSLQADNSVDLIACNPPFHSGASVSHRSANRLFIDAARTLRPGAQMLTVFNSHLPHRATLQRVVGPTVQLARNQKFTVTRTVKGS